MSTKTKNHKSRRKKTKASAAKNAGKTAAARTESKGSKSKGPRILVAGAMGLSGSAIFRKLIDKYGREAVLGIGRRPEGPFADVNYKQVNMHDGAAVKALFAAHQFDVVVQAAHVSFSPMMMRLADQFKVRRAILFLTTGVYSKFQSYRKDYEGYEAAILDGHWKHCTFTVLRPTMIYGKNAERLDYNLHKLIKLVKRSPVVPLFGGGKHSVQPVYYDDVAQAAVDVIDAQATYNKAFNLSGGTVIAYGDMLRMIAKLLKVRRIFLPIPIATALLGVKIKDWLWPERFVTAEQILRTTEQRVFSYHQARDAFGYQPRSLEAGLREEITMLQQAGLV